MPREKRVGTCSICGQEKPLFDVKNCICGSCAGKKGGGRPSALVKSKNQESSAAVLGEPRKPADTNPPASTSSQVETGVHLSASASNGAEKYLCDACSSPVQYGQQKCRKCGTWCDWRNTPVEVDPDIIICPECGAACGFTTNPPSVCPHCNSSGSV